MPTTNRRYEPTDEQWVQIESFFTVSNRSPAGLIKPCLTRCFGWHLSDPTQTEYSAQMGS